MNVSRTFTTVIFLLASQALHADGILSTKHNLTRTGPGTIKAIPELDQELCVFCHTPHRSRQDNVRQAFGWNRADSTATYTTYSSSTMYASVGQPSGASKLCLSCHDGTIALGSILSQRNVIPFQGDWDNSSGNLGTDLSDDHPISFVYDTNLAQLNGELTLPDLLPDEVRLDGDSQLQCTSCHDPHDNTNGSFLVLDNTGGSLCTSCHELDAWSSSAHATSEEIFIAVEGAASEHSGVPPQTVREHSCQGCHTSHNAGRKQGLLIFNAEEMNCLQCHNGSVGNHNIEAEMRKTYSHNAMDYINAHDAGEIPTNSNIPKHVECSDCHNAHQVGSSVARELSNNSAAGVSGVGLLGDFVERANYQYEICFKCHSDNNVIDIVKIDRQIPQLNTRLEFQQENPSAHPVAIVTDGNLVPSLLPQYTTDSIIGCTDCHGSDQNTADGGSGPNGPHGSEFEYLLLRNYETTDYTIETPDAYALCYGCHDRNSILGDESFAEHDSHVRGQNTPCSVCHDPHGISETQGSVQNHQYLINFDINVVSPNSLGDLYWEEGSQGPGSSRCSLACHGVDHNNTEDKPIGFDPTNGLSGSPNSWPFSGAFPD